MSWESIVRDMIEEENPDLHAELLDDGGYEGYVADVTQRMVAGASRPGDRDRQARERNRSCGTAGVR